MEFVRSIDNNRNFVSNKTTFALLAVTIILALVGAFGLSVVGNLYNRWWLLVVIVPLLTGALYFQARLWPVARAVVAGIALAVVLAFGGETIETMRVNVANPPEFDFQVFWLHGRVAVENLPFYDSRSYYQIAEGREYTDVYKQEVLNSAFIYPLPSMFLFAPLGNFDLNTAFLLWYAVQSLALLASVLLCWRTFFAQSGIMGLVSVVALTLMLYGTWVTIFFGQSNILVLLLLILAFRDRDKPRMGLWLALGVFVKPFVAVLFLLPLLRMQWRTLILATVVGAIMVLASIIAFGGDNFSGFIGANVAENVPEWMYTETVNQSLLATILRLTGGEIGPNPIINPLYLAGAGLLVIVTSRLIFRTQGTIAESGFMLLIILAMVVYPASLTSYDVLAILPVLWVVSWWKTFKLPITGMIAGVTAFYVLVNLQSGLLMFPANLMFALDLMVIILWQRHESRATRQPLTSLVNAQ